MRSSYCLTLSVFFFVFALLTTPSTALPATYEIIVERLGDGNASLILNIDGEEAIRGSVKEDATSSKRIPARTYTECSATKLKSRRRPGIYIPDEQTGRKGIFIRDISAVEPDGALAVVPELIDKIAELINEKDARNVTVKIRSEDVSASLAVFRGAVAESELELKSAQGGTNQKETESAQFDLTRIRNMLHLQEIAENCGALEDLVLKDMFFQELLKVARNKSEETVKKAIIKKAAAEVLKSAGTVAVKRFAIAVDLLWADDIGRDPDEVFRDSKSSDEELNQAIRALMNIDITSKNRVILDRSYRLLLSRLGFGDCTKE